MCKERGYRLGCYASTLEQSPFLIMSQVQTQIYTTSFLSICKTSTSQGQIRCTYVRRYSSDEAAANAVRQLQLLMSLDHPYISQVYEVKAEEGRRVRVETEWSGEDLASLPPDYVWTQENCWALLCFMTSALAYAQRQGIPHGSLLPCSIYKTEGSIYKLTGFLCPERPRKGETLWEVREPFYLSPELRSAYARLLVGEDIGELDCNPYKSDVYSLGLIIVSLLSPSSLPQLGSATALNVTVSSLPVHPEMQRLLFYMLATDSYNRPDWLELEPILQQMQGIESQEEQKVDVQPEIPPVEKKKKLKIIRKPRKMEESLPEFTPDPQNSQKICPRCNKPFDLNTSDSWRLDLIGSVDSEPAAKYCSLPCFHPAKLPSVSPSQPAIISAESTQTHLDLMSLSGRALSAAQQQQIESSIMLKGHMQFYHCFRHRAKLPSPEFVPTPTILSKCPECPTGEIRVEKTGPLQFTVAFNSMFPSLIFVQQHLVSAPFNVRLGFYRPVAASFRDTLLRAKCHICDKSVPTGTWACFFHGQRAELVCSSACMLQGTRSSICQTCGDPLALPRDLRITAEVADSLIGHISVLEENCCDLCLLSPNDWTLPCGCQFCISCLSLLPNHADMDAFSCFACGTIVRKDENRDLLEMLGWEMHR